MRTVAGLGTRTQADDEKGKTSTIGATSRCTAGGGARGFVLVALAPRPAGASSSSSRGQLASLEKQDGEKIRGMYGEIHMNRHSTMALGCLMAAFRHASSL